MYYKVLATISSFRWFDDQPQLDKNFSAVVSAKDEGAALEEALKFFYPGLRVDGVRVDDCFAGNGVAEFVVSFWLGEDDSAVFFEVKEFGVYVLGMDVVMRMMRQPVLL